MIAINKLDVSYRNYEDFVVIYNLRTKEIFKFEDVAADVLSIIYGNTEVDFDLIVDGILDIYECERADIENDINYFVQQLFEYGIIQIDENYFVTEKSNNDNHPVTDDVEGRIINLVYNKSMLYSVTFEMTYACNEKYIHCYANYPEDSDKKIVISMDKYKSILDELYNMNCMHIAFTGGDPFMYKGFEEVFTYARQKGFVCDIYTNGLYLSEHTDVLNRIIRLRPRAFYISLYGPDSDTHDRITTIPGSFEKTVKTISSLTFAGVSVVLNTMLLSVNCDKLDEIIKLAKELKAEYRVGMSLIYKNDGDSSPMKYFISDKEKIKTVLQRNNENVYSIDTPIGEENVSERMCGAGTTTLSISPDGIIYPCISLKIPLGNVANDSLLDVWNGNKRKDLEKLLSWDNAEECRNCESKKYCAHCPGISMAENNSLYACNTCDRMIAECVKELKNK